MTSDSLNNAGEETQENEPSTTTAAEGSETAQTSQLRSAYDDQVIEMSARRCYSGNASVFATEKY